MKEMKLDIHGRVYDMMFVPATHPKMTLDGELCWGRALYGESELLIDENISEEKQKETALHEVLHAMDPDMEEDKILSLTHNLFAFIRHNPDFIEYISQCNLGVIDE